MVNFSLWKDSTHLRNIVEIRKNQELKVKDTCLSYVKLQQPDKKVGILEDNWSRITSRYTASEKIETISTLQSFVNELIFSEMFETNANGVANIKNNLGTQLQPSKFHLNPNKIHMLPGRSKGVTSCIFDREVWLSITTDE